MSQTLRLQPGDRHAIEKVFEAFERRLQDGLTVDEAKDVRGDVLALLRHPSRRDRKAALAGELLVGVTAGVAYAADSSTPLAGDPAKVIGATRRLLALEVARGARQDPGIDVDPRGELADTWRQLLVGAMSAPDMLADNVRMFVDMVLGKYDSTAVRSASAKRVLDRQLEREGQKLMTFARGLADEVAAMAQGGGEAETFAKVRGAALDTLYAAISGRHVPRDAEDAFVAQVKARVSPAELAEIITERQAIVRSAGTPMTLAARNLLASQRHYLELANRALSKEI